LCLAYWPDQPFAEGATTNHIKLFTICKNQRPFLAKRQRVEVLVGASSSVSACRLTDKWQGQVAKKISAFS
jgi:hypothetical protein